MDTGKEKTPDMGDPSLCDSLGVSRPESLPTTKTAGRSGELQDYQRKLEKDKFVVIKGRRGVGKSQILASLVEQNPQQTLIWLDCERITDGLDSVLWEIAQSIHSDSFIRFLQRDCQQPRPYPNSAKLGRMFAHLLHLKTDHLICLNNAHTWYTNKTLENLIRDLRDYIKDQIQRKKAVPLSVVMLTQEAPHFLNEPVFDFLGGTTLSDLQAILAERGFKFSTELYEQIYKITQGHPKFAILFAQQLAQDEHLQAAAAQATEAEVARLALKNQILENEMAQQSDEALSSDERLILQATAIFSEPITPDMLKYVLREEPIHDIKRHQRQLINKYLLRRISATSYDFTISPLDREFYLSEADPPRLQEFNRKAAQYYHTFQGREDLAQFHRAEAERYGDAIDIAT